MQKLLNVQESYAQLDNYFEENRAKSILLVCGKSIAYLKINSYFETLEQRTGIKVIKFSDFQPNPVYDSVVKGVKAFHDNQCDMIVAVGGGSAMDVAKCIKLYYNMDHTKNYLQQTIVPNEIPFLAVPTTAGTGSEATRYAVIYYNGEKQSVSNYSAIPEAVIMDASVLNSLPDYQKKVTMLDALGHAIESYWSVNSTDESKSYAHEAIKIILDNVELYLQNDTVGNRNMLYASNLAGKAINITQTTAGHAMCYKLTSLYGIAHGHAVAFCIEKLWPYMLQHTEQCIDPRGEEYLQNVFVELAHAMECETPKAACEKYGELLQKLSLEPITANEDDINVLKKSVNPVRLKNNPVLLNEEAIESLYAEILGKIKGEK